MGEIGNTCKIPGIGNSKTTLFVKIRGIHVLGEIGHFCENSYFPCKKIFFLSQISKFCGWPAYVRRKTAFELFHFARLKLAVVEKASFRLANNTEVTLGEAEITKKKKNTKYKNEMVEQKKTE